jgi:NAD(P)-dependent dehydrogenase (short-subunit alcohol dehydrogenase family)
MERGHLEGKLALVTGASHGLGREIAVELARLGADVAVNYHSHKAEAEETVSLAKRQGVKAAAFAADVTDPAAVDSLFQAAEREFNKPVLVLVNNVGNFLVRGVSDTFPDEWRSVIDSNLNCSFYCSRRAVPKMREKKWGRIVNIGAAGASSPTAHVNTAAYYSAKAGLVVLTKSMAVSEAPHGITVNMVSPGVLTSSVAKFEFYPMGREARFEDVVNAIRFLLRPESDYVTGANVEVSGGMLI